MSLNQVKGSVERSSRHWHPSYLTVALSMTGSAYKFAFTLYAYFLFTRLQSDCCNCKARMFFSGTLVALNNALKEMQFQC
jgi:hypothetical protein